MISRIQCAALAIAMTAGLAGCGGGGGSAAAAKSSPATLADQALAYARCLRDHGVDVPDPNPNNPAISLPKASSGNQSVQAALHACQSKAPPKLSSGSDPAAQDHNLAVARCLRSHGVNVPDPQPGQPLSITGSLNDPKVQDAITTCQRTTGSGGTG